MKKILGISLVAVLAVSPLMARAEVVSADPSNVAGASAQATNAPAYPLAEAAATDGNAASAGYVKGAYNAAIKAVNRVASDLTTNLTMTEGDGIDITNNVVSVDYTSNGGLTVDGTSKKLEVVTDGSTIVKDSTSGALGVKANTFDAYGAAATAKSEAISAAAADATSKANAAQAAAEATAAADATSKANAAQSAAEATAAADATTKANAAQAAAEATAAADATTKANTAEQNAKSYANSLITDLGNVATQEGVENTIKNTGITVTDNKTVSLSGTVTGTNAGTITVMTDWTDPTHTTTHSYIGGVTNDLAVALGGTITAAIDDSTVDYSEPVVQPANP